MIDVMDIKLTVIKAACGLCSEDDAEVLRRLEALYLKGYEQGAKDTRELIGIEESVQQHSEEPTK